MSTIYRFVGSDTKPIPLILLAVAFERLVGPLTVSSGSLIAANGAHVDGSSALMAAFQVPGLVIRDPVAEGDKPGLVTAALVTRFESMKSVDDVADLVGANTAVTCRALADLWEKLKGTPYFTAYQIDRIRAVCLLGFLAFPASGKEVMNMNPDTPAERASVAVNDATRAGYDEVVKRFKVVRSAYYARQYGAAVAAAKASAADVAFWDSVHVVVKAVADAPAAVVGAVGDATLQFAGGFLRRTWYLFAIVGVAAFVWFNRSALARKANAKIGSAIGLPDAAA